MQLRWVRSYPSPTDLANIPAHRPRVVDELDLVYLTNYDYKTVSELNSLNVNPGESWQRGWPTDNPGFCMLEWDVALDPWSRKQFAATALREPREILVAPYRFWNTWSCWIGNDGGGPSEGSRPVKFGIDNYTDSFGLGCIYIPKNILYEFLPQMNHFGFTDGTFGKWYNEKYGKARVTWDVHPQHLHEYETD